MNTKVYTLNNFYIVRIYSESSSRSYSSKDWNDKILQHKTIKVYYA